MKSGDLNFLEPSGPLQACNRTALPLLCSQVYLGPGTVDVVPLAVNFLWLHSQLSSRIRKQSWNYRPVQYHPLMSSISKRHCCQLQFLSASIAQSSEKLLLFPLYNLTATLLDCMQTEGNACCC